MLTDMDRKFLEAHIPFLHRLSGPDRAALDGATVKARFGQGTPVINRQQECNGLVVVRDGQLRAFYVTEDGKEITLYRLLAGDVCILSASCVLKNITFEVTLEAERASDLYFIPTSVLSDLSGNTPAVKEFTADLLAERFSEVMWVMEQMVSKNMGQRVAAFLLDQSSLEGSKMLAITHETIARNLGTAREVISRVLKYLEGEGLIRLSRGRIEILDARRLRETAG